MKVEKMHDALVKRLDIYHSNTEDNKHQHTRSLGPIRFKNIALNNSNQHK
jgi:hypothetical protein